MRLEKILESQALRLAERTALVCGTERISYAALVERTQQVALGLRSRGIKPGDRVVLFLPNGVEIIELFFAAFMVGAIVVPVTTRLTAYELDHICRDCMPSVIAVDGASEAVEQTLSAYPQALRITIGRDFVGAVHYASIKSAATGELPSLPAEPDDALIMYTSGTTGKPKGAIITHANVIVQHRFINGVEWRISDEDCFLVTTPLAHRTGFARMANALTLGGTLVVMKKFDAREAVELICRESISVAGMVPTVCRMLLPEIQADPTKCASLRTIVVTGEAFPVDLKRKFISLLPSVRLVSFFAMTEAGAVTSLSHEEQFDHADSVGRPTAGVETRIVDEKGSPLPVGQAGELLVRAGEPGRYSVMKGYFNRPAENAEAIREGWIHTGDIAKSDEQGYLYIVDRKKDMVLSGGFNIYTKEVEQALMANPDIVDAAVVGVPDPIFGEAVAAFIEPAPGRQPTAVSVIEHVRDRIAGYKKPKHVFIVAELPRNSLGKVLKNELRESARHAAEVRNEAIAANEI
ncbi:class I adenylate-forming enzyme family protein [Bradyrhizobium mercantei]|uniref:class I adenylate-forming enzyme family protein n=1 Tax=Bradyrhizobium mercantei TaxID=1904807 RepID=UPI000977C44C|nr:AMP-binding protein [Bradyrhizobium mercantei]